MNQLLGFKEFHSDVNVNEMLNAINEKEDISVKDAKELLKKAKEKQKQLRKENRRKASKLKTMTGQKFKFIKKREKDQDSDTFEIKGKGKQSKIWTDSGKVADEVWNFINDTLDAEDVKYLEDSLEVIDLKDGKKNDSITFKIDIDKGDLETEEEKEKEETKEETKEEEKEETKEEEKEKVTKKISIDGSLRLGDSSPKLREIKNEIVNAFGDNEQLAALPSYKRMIDIKNEYGNYSSKFKEEDVKLVKILQAGFSLPVTGNIDQALIDKIYSQIESKNTPVPGKEITKAEEVKVEAPEPVKPSGILQKLSNSRGINAGKKHILNYANYLLLEQFNMELAMKQAGGSESSATDTDSGSGGSSSNRSSSSRSSSRSSSKAFPTKLQSDAYRLWANHPQTIKLYGKEGFDLDATGKNNSYVKRSFTKAKKDMDENTGLFADSNRTNERNVLQSIIDNKQISAIVKQLTKNLETGNTKATSVKGFPMGYIQHKNGNRIAVHFDSPRPKSGAIKKGQIVTFTNGWDSSDFGYVVDGVWKDTSGKLGAIYIISPSFVKEYGKPNKDRTFQGKAGIVVTDQSKTSNLKDRFIRRQSDDDTAVWISNKIKFFWNHEPNFTAFKGSDDNEAGAIAMFTKWWIKSIQPKIDKMRTNDPNKATLNNLFNTIVVKAEGSTSNDTAYWVLSTLKGGKSYSVDTDF